MMTTLPAIEGADAAGGGRFTSPNMSLSLDGQLGEASRALERARRDLAVAMTNQSQRDELVASVRRRIEAMHYMGQDAAASGQVQQAAAQVVASLNLTMEDALKGRSDALSDIEALHTRIVQQYWRVSALEERRRAMSSEQVGKEWKKDVTPDKTEERTKNADKAPPEDPAAAADAARAELVDLLVTQALREAESRKAEAAQIQRHADVVALASQQHEPVQA